MEHKFPDPVPPPKEIPKKRALRVRELIRSSTQGIVSRCLIAGVELVAAIIFSSASLFMDALATSFDIFSSLLLILGFKLAARPPDENHPFGHGRYEPLAGLQLGLFLSFLGVGMFFYNITEINQHDPYSSINPYLWIIPLGGMILLEACYQTMKRAAKKENSPALSADAAHYRVDSISSFFAFIALLSASYSPRFSQFFDHLGAALISIFMVILGLNAAKKNLNQLLDHIPPEAYFEKVRKAALRTPGVLGTEKLGIQLYGPDAHVDIDVEVDPKLSVVKAHEISQQVRVEIQKDIPQVRDVIVHIEPYYPGDHDEVSR